MASRKKQARSQGGERGGRGEYRAKWSSASFSSPGFFGRDLRGSKKTKAMTVGGAGNENAGGEKKKGSRE